MNTELRKRKASQVTLLLVFIVMTGIALWLLPIDRDSRLLASEGDPDPQSRSELIGSTDNRTYTLKVRRASSGPVVESSLVTIAAGGQASDVHRAMVSIEFDPPLEGGTEVRISLIDGGDGFEPSSWWWQGNPRVRAKLEIAGETYIYGTTSAPIATSPTSASLTGTLTSSNAVEGTTVKVEVVSQSVVLTAPVDFVVGEFVVDLPPIELNVWTDFTMHRKLDAHGIGNHDIKMVVTKVLLADGTGLGADVGASQGTSVDLSAYVEVDGPLSVTSYQEGTTDVSGDVSGQFRVIDSNVVAFEIAGYDMTVAENASE